MLEKKYSAKQCLGCKTAAEEGFTLLSVIIVLALLTISLSIAVPQISRAIQRDKELECLHRGQQYARAIRLYYRRTGNFPTDIAQLENTGNIRFLRKAYKDPITNSDWKLVYQGEVKPEILDQGRQFFGVSYPMTPAATPTGVIPARAPPSTSAVDNYGTNGGAQLLDPATGQPVNSSASGSTQAATDTQDTTGGSGSAMGNRRIVGVCSRSTKGSIRVYKKQTHYNDWQFVYDPASDGISGGTQPSVNGVLEPAGASAQPAPMQ